MSTEKVVVGISQGDINGIGLEVILKTFSDPLMLEICTPVLFSSQKTVSFYRKTLNIEEFNFNSIREADQAHARKFNVVNCYDEDISIESGKSTAQGGKYALRSLTSATEALANKKIDAIVTAPINKNNIQSDDFHFPGHTEYFDHKFGNKSSLMILAADKLKVALVSGHVTIAQIPSAITIDNILKKLEILKMSLLEDFGIRKPKIAVLGLNPHAGDNGTLGNEEKDIILPALAKAKESGLLAYGPYPADGFFGSGNYQNFDAVLAMYHDQGLIPFKALSFNSGVNFTAGLPVVRTSPDHGTAYDIAGKNIASEDSFRKAVYLACDIFKKREEYKEMSSNPLKINPIKKER
jgi:4-hydroxythreonine-4-phosphate dehydrogenase